MDNGLSAASISHNLDTRFIGQRVIYYPTVTSTMEIARRETQNGAAEGTVILADEQTAGRGRLKRLWLSPRGSVALSVILYPALEYLPYVIMMASLAVARSIEVVTGLNAGIKWPNDIFINGKKVCGILIENEVQKGKVNFVIVGIGINVNLGLADYPEILPIATSLSDELGREVSRLDIIQRLLAEMESLYLAVTAGESIYEEWRDKLIMLGKRVTVTIGEARYEGTALSVERDGRLLLRLPDGSLAEVVAGDVTLRD